MATFLSRYLNSLSETDPFINSQKKEHAFDKVKQVSTAPVPAYYDLSKPLLENDANEYRLGSVLVQDDLPVIYSNITNNKVLFRQIKQNMYKIVDLCLLLNKTTD